MKKKITQISNKMNRIMYLFIKTAFISVLAVLCLKTKADAQTIPPVKYWTFNGANATADSMGVFNLNFTNYGSQYTLENNGRVGKFITLGSTGNLIDGGPFTLNNAFSVEFLFKPGDKFNLTNLFRRGDGAFSVSIEYAKLTFYTSHKSSSGATIEDSFVINLDGIGRKAFGYYTDGNWHHLVFKFNAATGQKEVWVDGQLPAGFSKTVSTTGYFPNTGNINFLLNHTVSYVKYFGSIDELAIYNSAIPGSLIYKHYLGTQIGQPYSFLNDYVQTLPAAAAVSGPLDMLEFAPGHPSVTVTANEQMIQFPVPRYKPGNTLLKNFNWMDPRYMGGLFQNGVTQQQAAANGVAIQTEMAKNFNYYFNVERGTGIFPDAWVNAANANPDFKLALIILRAQLNGSNPEILNQNKSASHYLQNASGQFLDANGNVTSNKIWRPTAPTSSYNADGNTVLAQMNDLFSRLNRDIDIINENGEVFPHISDAAMSKDPDVTAAKNASGLDWQTFQGRKFYENETQSYRNIFMAHPRLANTKFTEYAIDGFTQYRMKYSEARKVNSMINGQYYATPDFYPRWPSNWRNWQSAWHGWQWIVDSRVNELAVGDRLYSPFVAAGWDVNEEMNIRPAQWLGLLKCLGATGAEFYYAGFFSLSAPWPDSKNWIWQAVMPSYAQAVTSRYEDILRNGDLMNGDVANYYNNPTAPGYAFWAGDLRKLVVIRKHNSGTKYAITGTIQPNSNMIGNTENESVATITLDGQQLKFNVRRQGSTYIYDKSNPASPVFYQIDGWHEKTHPYRWTKDFSLEAELFDNTNSQVTIKTVVPAGTPAGDFTNFTSYVAWPDGVSSPTPVEFNFTPRTSGGSTYYVWVRARSRGGVTTSMNVQLNNNTAMTIGCISDTAWTWYRYDACTQQAIRFQNVTFQNQILRITPSNPKLEIDKILLTSDAGLILNAAPPLCSAATATISASGNTTFCQGGNVVLTASSGTSYLWSPGGQTTQSITVSVGGSYSVTVGSGAGCNAVSNPTQVTVNTNPSATITPSGSTNLCSGSTVTLSAPAGAASYLWTPGGQTTQSITTGTAGNYTVRVTNSSGCSTTSSATNVTVSAAPAASITAGGPTTFCQGGSVTLTAAPASSYFWQPGGQTTQSVTVNASGSYTVRATNSSGCSATSSATVVTVNSLPTANITAGGATTFCSGGNVTLTASAGSSYLWQPGGQTTSSINVSNSGSYTVRVTNSSGCSATSSATNVTVNANPAASITPSGSTSLCSGGSVTLTATGGTGFLWNTGATSASIPVSTAGTYTVTVSSSAGCSAVSSPQTVSVAAPVNASVTPDGPTTLSPGQSVTLTGSGGVSYVWSPGGQTTSAITVSTPGNYYVTAYDASGCSGTSSAVTVTLATTPPFNATISTNGGTSICPGANLTLTASAGSAWLWTPGGQTTRTITVNTAGTYTVTVTDSAGQSTSDANIEITYKPVPGIPAIIASYIPNSSFQLKAYEPSAHQYQWSHGPATQSIIVNSPGTYSVVAISASGCSSAPETMVVNSVSPQSCVSPDMLVNYNITRTAATLAWNPAITAQSFIVEYTRISDNTSYTEIVPGNTSSLRLTGLTAGETYKWVVISMCGFTQAGSVIKTFTTLNGPLPCGSTPQNLVTEVVNSTFARVSWTETDADDFVLRYREVGTSTYKHKRFPGTNINKMIMGLTPNTTYEWSIRTICNNTVSLYSEPAEFTTLPTCPSIGAYWLIDVSFDKAKLGWNSSLIVDTIMIRYAVEGTTNYKVIKITGDPNPGEYFIMNLLPETTYRAWVSTKCSSGSTSMWGQGIVFTTFPEPVTRTNPEAGPIHLNAYPNPTRNQINYVFDSEDDKEYTVKVCDMTGRELFSETRVSREGKTGEEVQLAGFSTGMYMLIVQKGPITGRFKFNIN